MKKYDRIILELNNLNIKVDNLKTDISILQTKLVDGLHQIENNTDNGISYGEFE